MTGEEWLAKEQRLIEKYGKLTIGQVVELVENQEEALRASKSQIAAGCRAMLDARDAEIEQLRAALHAACPQLQPCASLYCHERGHQDCAYGLVRAALAQAEETTQAEAVTIWRVGAKVPVNVYDGDRPVCQCHSAADALRIVTAVNALKE